MFRKLVILPALLLAVTGMARDTIEEGNNQLGKSHKPLVVRVDDQGNHSVFESEALTAETVKSLKAADANGRQELLKQVVSEVDRAGKEIDASLAFDDRSSAFKEEVSGKPAWWYYSYGWSFYYYTSWSYSYVYYPVYYISYPVYRYTYWIIW